jgi:hypothetical protein
MTTIQSQLTPFVEEIRHGLSAAKSGGTISIDAQASLAVKQALTEAGCAIQAWQNSAEGQARLKAMQQSSIAEIRQNLTSLLQSQVFAPTFELLSKPTFPVLNNPIQSVSIALKAEVELIIGLSFSIGIAVSLKELLSFFKDPTSGFPQASVFISGWIDEGVDGGGIVGVEFGVYGSTPDDLGGYATGIEGTIEPGPESGIPFGLSAQYFKGSSDSSWGATVAVVEGVDAGVEFTESYTILVADINPSIPPIHEPTPPNGHMVTIDIIQCIKTLTSGSDNVNFRFCMDGNNSTVYRFPTWDIRRMSDGYPEWDYHNTWYPGQCVKFVNNFTLCLWNDNTQIWCVSFSITDWTGPSVQIKRSGGDSGASYAAWLTLVY